jgi:hypothetical protein
MGDDRHHRLRLCAVYASRCRARLPVLDGLEAIGQVGEPEVSDLGFGGFAALAGPFAVWPSRRASSRTSVRVTMGPLIPWGSCSDTRPMFGQLEVMGASWLTGSLWLRRESLTGGSAGCP